MALKITHTSKKTKTKKTKNTKKTKTASNMGRRRSHKCKCAKPCKCRHSKRRSQTRKNKFVGGSGKGPISGDNHLAFSADKLSPTQSNYFLAYTGGTSSRRKSGKGRKSAKGRKSVKRIPRRRAASAAQKKMVGGWINQSFTNVSDNITGGISNTYKTLYGYPTSPSPYPYEDHLMQSR